MLPAPAISGDTGTKSVPPFSQRTANEESFYYLPVRTHYLDGASEHMDEIDCRHTQDVKSPRVQKSWKQGHTVHAGHSMVQQKLAKKCKVKHGSEYKYEQTLEVMPSDPC